MFKKYQHLERLGTSEVEGILLGKCHIQPKLDGTNASIWLEGDEIKFGSRNRQLTLDNDNQGFVKRMSKDINKFRCFFSSMSGYVDLSKWRLYGEYLRPHTFKEYRDDAWNEFYVFDVIDDRGYVQPDMYIPVLEEFGIHYVPVQKVIENPSIEQLNHELVTNKFLLKEGVGCGEGIVIKNYDFVNRYNRTTWAKLISNNFKSSFMEKHPSAVISNSLIEEEIVDKFVIKHLVDKVKAKIETESEGFSSKDIPRLLNTVFYDLVREEMWSIVKEYKMPTINFKTLKHFTILKAKEIYKDLF